MFSKKIILLLLVLVSALGMLGGCNKTSSSEETEMFTSRDYETDYDESKSVLIRLNGDSAACSSSAVQISGTTVTITGEGTYVLSGTLHDGMIVVNAKETDKLQIVLNGVTIHSETSAPLYILEADKVFLTLAEGTANTLSNGGVFTAVDENNIDAAVFSKQDLTLNGLGSLAVISPAGHGIVSKDELVFTGGTYTVNSASHGLDANDSVQIANAEFHITSGKDGVHAENAEDEAWGFVYIASGTIAISAGGDGISAGAYMQIEAGNFDIVSGGGSVNAAEHSSDSWGEFPGRGNSGESNSGENNPGGAPPTGGGREEGETPRESGKMPDMGTQEIPASDLSDTDDSASMKALKASGDLLINSGTFILDAADDAVHSNTSVTVNGGSFEIASGDDGFHADEKLTITAGTIHITESYEGLEALHVVIAGGDVKLTADDDGINAAGGADSSGFGGHRGDDRFGGGGAATEGSIVISGGNLYVKASGDGIDANGTLLISGGVITLCGPTDGDTSVLDYDLTADITGGIFIGTGSSNMAQSFTSSGQGVTAVTVGTQSAGTSITLKDKNGNIILSHEPEQAFDFIILSSPDIMKGEVYTLSVGSASQELTA